MEDHDPRAIPRHLNFVFGGMAGVCAITVIQPAELVKIRMQMRSAEEHVSALQMTKDIYKARGIVGLYDGMTAAILRQCTYTTSRLGFFSSFYDKYLETYKHYPTLTEKVGMGMVAGGLAGLIGNPADLAMVRMSVDGQLPKEQRRNYTSVFNALFRIIKEEGLLGIFRGATSTMTRCIAVNASTLASYAHAREWLLPYLGDTVKLHFSSSLIAGAACTLCSLPFDTIKTRVQQHKGKISQIAVVREMVTKEGPFALYKGIIPMYVTIGPQTILIFVCLEQIKRIYREMAYPDYVPPERPRKEW